MAWIEQLTGLGLFKDAQPLDQSGKIVQKQGAMLTDKPLAETREAVGGYFLIKARDLDHAAEVAGGCPIIEVGGTVEVRPVRELKA